MTSPFMHPHLLIYTIACLSFTTPLWAQWSRTSGPEGGYAADLLSTPQALLLGLESGGVYRSTDDGMTWQYASTGLVGLGAGADAFAMLGTKVFVSTGFGISISVDGGQTWTPTTNGLPSSGLYVAAFAVRSPNALFAGADDGIYRTLDSGATWTKTSAGLTDSSVRALISTATHVFAGTENGVFRSSNDGVSWELASTGLAAGDGMEILGMAALPGVVVAGTRQGAYHSSDNGTTWTQAASGLTSHAVPTVFASGTDFFAGTFGTGVYRSTDAGAHWSSSSQGWSMGNVRAMCVHNGALFGGNYGSPVVYKSTDNGASWTPSGNGITSELTYALAADSSRVYAATVHGLQRTSDYGGTWVTPPSPLSSAAIYSVFLIDGLLFAGTAGDGPYVSTDNGTNWSAANGNLPAGSSRSILSFAADSSYLYTGTYAGVYRSSDHGASWQAAKAGLTDSATFALCTVEHGLLAGTSKGIYRSTNNGSSWTAVPSDFSTFKVGCIVTMDGAILATVATVPSVYRSTDDGLSWSPFGQGLSAAVRTLLIVGGNLFGGAVYDGVWLSTDKGGHWSTISNGLSGPGLMVVGLASSGGYLFAAGSKGGVWRRPLSQVVAVEEENSVHNPYRFSIEQNYPNPFNPSTVIRYECSARSNVRLVVCDLLGRQVAELVREMKDPGSYEVEFVATGLASGVYVYRLTAGTYSQSRRMLLLR